MRQVFYISLFSIAIIFVYLPIILLIFYSFNQVSNISVFEGFSLKWYKILMSDADLLDSVYVSFKVAFISASISVVVGGMSGYVLGKYRKFPAREFLNTMVSTPFVVPEIIVGFAMLMFFVVVDKIFFGNSVRGSHSIIIAHSIVGIAYVSWVVSARMKSFDFFLEEAASDLGAKPLAILFSVVIPINFPALISSWLLAFIISFDDLVIASFTSGPGSTTLPMLIYSRIRIGITPELNALASIIIFGVSSCVMGSYLIWARNKKYLLNLKRNA